MALSANTRLTKDRQPVKLADIKVGDAVGAMGVLDAPTKTVHAVFVGVVDAEQMKKARENMGKTYITGKVTAIDMDALKLTVMRPDGVSQVIGVDEQTSFKRGGRGMAAMASGNGVIEMAAAEEDEGWAQRQELAKAPELLLDQERVWGRSRSGKWRRRREYYVCRCESWGYRGGARRLEEWPVCADRARCDGSGSDGAKKAARCRWQRPGYRSCRYGRAVWCVCSEGLRQLKPVPLLLLLCPSSAGAILLQAGFPSMGWRHSPWLSREISVDFRIGVSVILQSEARQRCRDRFDGWS